MRNTIRQLRFAERSGMALMLVIAVIAVAAVMGMAMLSMGALQSQASNNALQGPALDSLAESGVNAAMYYLQNPWIAGVNSSNYWTGQTGMTFGASVSGTCDVTVAAVSGMSNTYDITSIGRLNGYARTIRTRAQVYKEFQVKAAVASNGAFRIANVKQSVTGDVWNNGQFRVDVLTQFAGNAYAGSNYQSFNGDFYPLPSGEGSVVPATCKDYRTYTYNGQTYNADQLFISTLVIAPVASSTNPGNVFYYNGNVTLGANFSMTGTLVCIGGRLNVSAVNTITPRSGLPALITDQEIRYTADLKRLTANGFVWTGGGIKASGSSSNCTLVVNGAIQFPGSTTIDPSYTGGLTVAYDSSKVAGLSDFTTGNKTPKNVKVLSWNQ